MNETQLSNIQVGKSTPWLAAGAVIVIAGLLGLAKYQGWPVQFHCDYVDGHLRCSAEMTTR